MCRGREKQALGLFLITVTAQGGGVREEATPFLREKECPEKCISFHGPFPGGDIEAWVTPPSQRRETQVMRLQKVARLSHFLLIIGQPFQEQVGADAVIGRGQGRTPGTGKVLIALSPSPQRG